MKYQNLNDPPESDSSSRVNVNVGTQHILTYSNLRTAVDLSARDPNNLYEVKKIPGYFLLERKKANNHSEGNYKIHISVDNSQLQIAWDIIIPILVEANIDSFKVHDGDMLGFQPGKHIVIYTNIYDNIDNSSSLEVWKKLLENINQKLKEENISLGEPSCFRFGGELTDISEPKFNGGDYCYIRRSIVPKENLCGLCNKSEKQLLTKMSEHERCGVLVSTSLQSIPRTNRMMR